MSKMHFYVAMLGMGILLGACGSHYITGKGPVQTEQRSLDAFMAIDIDAPVETEIRVDSMLTPGIALTGQPNLLAHIKTDVRNQILHISIPDGVNLETDEALKVLISVRTLSDLSLSGAAEVKVRGLVRGPHLNTQMSGASELDIEQLQVERFRSDLSGAAELSIQRGWAGKAEYEASGSSEIHAFGLQAEEAVAQLSGASDADVYAQRRLNVRSSGASSLRYKGNPAITQKTTGASSMARAD